MSNQIPYNDEFPEDRVIEDLERSLLDRYRDNAKYHNRLKSSKITRVRRYKKTRHVERKYLVAEVSMPPALGDTRYLRIERSINALPTTTGPKWAPLQSHPDHVTTMLGWPVVDKWIEDIDCRKDEVTLLDLVIQ